MLYAKLAEIVASGRISHAWLLTGRPEQTLEQAVQLAKALLCHQPGADGQACGHCASCRKLAAGNHPDVQLILPRGASVKIDQTRSMQYTANLESYEGGRRVVIIHQAHTMPPAAANSLLKILEEPKDGLFFILTAPLGDSLLETILSRVVWLRLPDDLPAEGDDVYFTALLPELAKEQELRAAMQEKCRRLLDLLAGSDNGAALLVLAKSFRDDKLSGSVKHAMAVFLEELLAALRQQAAGAILQAAGEQAELSYGGRLIFSAQGALSAALLVEEAIRDIDANVNGVLTLSVLFLRIYDLKLK
ncbi:MAG: hypothetical protein IJE29_06330 [Firmicutes bacterium]|nr:hypothetical protein [Bacillota bacterium]